MSDIKRHKAVGSGVVRTDPKGDLVLYVDYARLKAEVERLTKAGDDLADGYQNGDWNERMIFKRISAWNSAKGGQP